MSYDKAEMFTSIESPRSTGVDVEYDVTIRVRAMNPMTVAEEMSRLVVEIGKLVSAEKPITLPPEP